MVPLSSIMTAELVTVSPDLTLQEVARVFAASAITGAPVVSGRELVGVISTTDLVEFETTNPGSPRQRENQIDWGEIDTLPVLDGSEESEPGLYFTEMWADAGADVLARFQTDSPEWNRMAETTIGSVMTTSVVSLPPDSAVQDAARIMALANVHRILVVDESGELVGLVSSTDIVKAVAESGLAEALPRHADESIRFYREGRFPVVGLPAVMRFVDDSPRVHEAELEAAHVARSGDFGYTYGSGRKAQDDESVVGFGFARIWRRDDDGAWKIVLDIVPLAP